MLLLCNNDGNDIEHGASLNTDMLSLTATSPEFIVILYLTAQGVSIYQIKVCCGWSTPTWS